MITKECIEKVLPVVADDWRSLRKCDVFRLLNQIHYLSAESVMDAGRLIVKQRKDLQQEVRECVDDIIEEQFSL